LDRAGAARAGRLAAQRRLFRTRSGYGDGSASAPGDLRDT